MYKDKKIAVIIPALNEEQSLPVVFRDIPAYVDTIIVTDNGSTDNTYDVIVSADTHPNIIGCKEPKRGYGYACLRAMHELSDEDIIVFLDADNSDDPKKMNLLLDPLINDMYDVVISNRFNKTMEKGAMSNAQYFGNKLAVFLVRMFWGFKYHDMGPFRSITHRALKQLVMQDTNFGWTIELQVKALRHNLGICQVDVPYRCRRAGKSKVSKTISGVIGAGTKILSLILLYKLREIYSHIIKR